MANPTDSTTSRPGDGFVGVAPMLRHASDPTRARILAFLAGRAELGASVSDVVDETGLGQPTVSHHLKVLFDAGLVTRNPQGSWVRYRLDPAAVRALADGVTGLVGRGARRSRTTSSAPDDIVPGSAPGAAAPGPLHLPAYPPPRPSGRPLPSARRGGGG
jgi:ArsR family transcriptional regulator